MAAFAIFVIAPALAGACAGRWTRLHPLLIGLATGAGGTALAMLVFGLVLSPAAALAGALVGVIVTAVASFGAFIGWLRRMAVERSR